MSDISEIKIAIDKASKQMYEAFSSGKLDSAWKYALKIEQLGLAAKWDLGAKLEQSKRQLD